jgi:hypothetical protein
MPDPISGGSPVRRATACTGRSGLLEVLGFGGAAISRQRARRDSRQGIPAGPRGRRNFLPSAETACGAACVRPVEMPGFFPPSSRAGQKLPVDRQGKPLGIHPR